MKLQDIKWGNSAPAEGHLALAKFTDGKIHLVTSQVDHYPSSSSSSGPPPGPTPPPPGPGPGTSGLLVFGTRQVIKPPPGTVYSILGLIQDLRL